MMGGQWVVGNDSSLSLFLSLYNNTMASRWRLYMCNVRTPCVSFICIKCFCVHTVIRLCYKTHTCARAAMFDIGGMVELRNTAGPEFNFNFKIQ